MQMLHCLLGGRGSGLSLLVIQSDRGVRKGLVEPVTAGVQTYCQSLTGIDVST